MSTKLIDLDLSIT